MLTHHQVIHWTVPVTSQRSQPDRSVRWALLPGAPGVPTGVTLHLANF